MNKVILIGRLTADPEVTYHTGENATCIARYSLAVDRGYKPKDGNEPTADFLRCVCFGKNGEFAEKYLKKGMKIAVEGSIRTGSYTNRDGVKVYTTDINVDRQEFCESKGTSENKGTSQGYQPTQASHSVDRAAAAQGFMDLSDDLGELPFN